MARPAASLAFALAALTAVGGIGWLVYEWTAEGESTAPPLIKADQGPMKIRPKDPGGMMVPDQDKLIYQSLNGGVVEETVERLLPPPEEPLPPPEPPAPEVVAEPPPAVERSAPDGNLPLLPPAEAPSEASATVEAPEPEPKAPPEPAPAPPSAPAPAAATAAATGSYMVQLASFRSIDDADKAWRKAIKKNGDLLSAYSAQVVRADLGGDQGVYFRLRIGPFAGGGEAKSLCEKLKARNADCFVVRP